MAPEGEHRQGYEASGEPNPNAMWVMSRISVLTAIWSHGPAPTVVAIAESVSIAAEIDALCLTTRRWF